MELVAHGVQCQCQCAGLGLEQVAVGRALGLVLGAGEPRAFGEVHHAGRHEGKLLAGTDGRQADLLPQFGVAGELRRRMPFHERKVQRPPGQPDHRHVDELLLQEELQHRDAPVQHVLQHEDVGPGLVVAVHQVPAGIAQAVDTLHVPGRGLGQAHPAAVAGDPERGDGVEHGVDAQAHGAQRQHQLDQRKGKQQRAPEQGVQHQQHERDHAPCGRWQEAQHGRFIPERLRGNPMHPRSGGQGT